MNETPWTTDPFSLAWPAVHIFKINPFLSDLTDDERVNAHARLTLLLGFSLAYIFYSEKKNDMAKLVLFWTVLLVLNQGVTYVQTQHRAAATVKTAAPPEIPPPPPPPPRKIINTNDDVPLWLRWQQQFNFSPNNVVF